MIGIIDYKMGNIQSVMNALTLLGEEFILSDEVSVLQKADKLILPGVGAAKDAMKNIEKLGLKEFLITTKKPMLGICLGMQILFDQSKEGNTQCLGIIKGEVKRFPDSVKVPQIGWNEIIFRRNMINHVPTIHDVPIYYYFVNSYYCEPENENLTVASAFHGLEFCAIVKQDNTTGFQFHPEKSGEEGIELLRSWISKL